jgi:cephalosporin hydroxylase
LILLEGDSKDKKIIGSVKEPIELLFIDGDHSYDGIFGDITNWVPKVMSGGYVVIHDVFSEQVNDEHKCPDIIKASHDTLGEFTDFKMCNKFGFMKEKWSRVDTCMILQKE